MRDRVFRHGGTPVGHCQKEYSFDCRYAVEYEHVMEQNLLFRRAFRLNLLPAHAGQFFQQGVLCVKQRRLGDQPAILCRSGPFY